MQRVVIFGNSASGKSTLAKEYVVKYDLAYLDLDILAWENTVPPIRRNLGESFREIDQFQNEHERWVIEGYYSDLLSHAIEKATEIVFLNPGVERCVSNCHKRPWEPHKYKSMEEQNKNLEMLIEWIKQYPSRTDEFSLTSHQRLFNEFAGKKTEYRLNK